MAISKRDNDHAPSDSENCQIKPGRISLGFLLRVGQYIWCSCMNGEWISITTRYSWVCLGNPQTYINISSNWIPQSWCISDWKSEVHHLKRIHISVEKPPFLTDVPIFSDIFPARNLHFHWGFTQAHHSTTSNPIFSHIFPYVSPFSLGMLFDQWELQDPKMEVRSGNICLAIFWVYIPLHRP